MYDDYFLQEEGDLFSVAGKEITQSVLFEALNNLPKEKRNTILLYYFYNMNDVEIEKYYNIPRSTVQYRRISSYGFLKQYLEECNYDW